MRYLYTALFYCLLPFAFLRLWRRGAIAPAYRLRWPERRGKVPTLNTGQRVLWFHTVSVGEFIAATPLIEHYCQKNDYHIVITCTTPTGSERIRASFGDRVSHYYLPYDIPLFLNRFIRAMKPSKFICLETELWPNLIHCCHQSAIPIILANARLSEKSANGYKKFPSLTRAMLESLSAAAIQNTEDAERFIQLGLNPENSHSIGNIKFDLDISDDLQNSAKALKQRLASSDDTKILIGASTHTGEDEIVLDAFARLRNEYEHLKLILVPRHPERFKHVHALCNATSFKAQRRSEMSANDNEEHNLDILIGDTMGELLLLYGASDIAFVGGSFVNNGGHNYIEPAAWALPIFSGPSTFNFREIAKEMQKAQGLDIVSSGLLLAEHIKPLLDDDDTRIQMGQYARLVAESNRGALQKLIEIIDHTDAQ